jgi:hypothetical protein
LSLLAPKIIHFEALFRRASDAAQADSNDAASSVNRR